MRVLINDHQQYVVIGSTSVSYFRVKPRITRAGATSPVGQVSTGPLFSPSALTADLGDYDVCGSIDERSTGSTELAVYPRPQA